MSLRQSTGLQITSGGRGLIELFPVLVGLLAENLDVLGKITSILEGYFLLGANDVLKVLFRQNVRCLSALT